MIKVLKIEVQEFRGIRNLSLDFAGENFAICGRNGTGKSGIVDALEFGLTGNISRLSGRGTGDISLKEHAPHVDSRNRPDKARVKLTVKVANFDKPVVIERSVNDPLTPTVTPSTPAVLDVLRRVALHPEFALSRRELIRYVISAPGDRAKEVQILLQLDAVDSVRTTLQKIANASQREINPLKRARTQAHEQLLLALDVSNWNTAKVLAAVNARRSILGLAPLGAIAATTSLRDGLDAAGSPAPARLPKAQALAGLRELRELLTQLGSEQTKRLCAHGIALLQPLVSDPNALDSVNRERFLKSAIGYIEAEACPVCDTEWNPEELRTLIAGKLRRFEEIARQREAAEKHNEPLVSLLETLGNALRTVERYGGLLTPKIETKFVEQFRQSTERKTKTLGSLDPMPEAAKVLETFSEVPPETLATLASIESGVAAIPEPTDQDAARDYLTVGQERLQAYRDAAVAEKRAEERAALTRKVFETYGEVSTSVLNGIYKQVEGQFGDLYRFINREDEAKFTAHLTPSMGKLGFDVDFYGRGFFPPGAYHSEGHQDGMGICLYLALMKHLLGDSFSFAVLDDVLMSVDSGHRREVCNLLKAKFPHTQFILTTHDEIWLRHMKSAGLIAPKAFIQFRTWNVEHGPTEWEDRDIWKEIDDEVKRNDVRSAAALLRHYLEYASAEICHRLRAPVEFRGDAQFQLGDLLPAAISKLGALLREGKAAAQSWGKKDEAEAIAAREAEFKKRVEATKVDAWQINSAVHYNSWENFTADDFAPVVAAYRDLMQSFACANPQCSSLLYVQPERGTREEVRCACNGTNINLRKK
jgi:recombinational DNA repair ATPase RecF